MQQDLFAHPPIVPGLGRMDAIISLEEEEKLVWEICQARLSQFRFQGWTGKRLTHSFGWRYDFETGAFGRADPIPDWLLPLRARAADFAGLAEGDLVQALLIQYDPGAGIGWHRDRPLFEHVVGISLGAPAVLRLRRRSPTGFERARVPLTPRGAYHLAGEVRHEWEHSIAPIEAPRWSITFRSFSGKGERARA
jgi:alkylated DNA repair dioxygenase AlkB